MNRWKLIDDLCEKVAKDMSRKIDDQIYEELKKICRTKREIMLDTIEQDD